MDSLAPRAALALIAVVLIAWCSVLARNYWLGEAASKRIIDDPRMGAVEWSEAMDDLRKAEWLDPGTEWRMNRANYLLVRDEDTALRLAESVVRREPENLNAWTVILKVTTGRDPRRAAEAAEQVRRLNPTPAISSR